MQRRISGQQYPLAHSVEQASARFFRLIQQEHEIRYFILLLPCTFLQLTQQTTNTLKIDFITIIILLHVSAPERHPQGDLYQRNISPRR